MIKLERMSVAMDRSSVGGMSWIVVLSIATGHGAFGQTLDRLDETWTVRVGGQTARVNPDGSFLVRNVAVTDFNQDGFSDDFLRVVASRQSSTGVIGYAYSDPTLIQQNGTSPVEMTIASTPIDTPISVRIASSTNVLQPNQQLQLSTFASFPGVSEEQDVTPRTALTNYRTSNPIVAIVGEDGLVTAISTGESYLTAVNQGTTTVRRIIVIPTTIPTTVEGFVQFADGTPIESARVSILGTAGGTAFTNSTGFFAIPLTLPPAVTQLSLVATATISGQPFRGTIDHLPVAVGGITDAGMVTLSPAYDGPLFPESEYVTGDVPLGVAVGDVNQDGDMDVVSANYSSSNIAVFLGHGHGQFSQANYFSVGSSNPFGASNGPEGVVLTNLNNDTYLDAVVSNFIGDKVGVLLGTGSGPGLFLPVVNYSVNADPTGLAAADVDGDGDIDIAVTSYASGTAQILKNNGSGVLTVNSTISVGVNPRDLAFGLINNDTAPDLAVPNPGTGTVSVCLNSGMGTFSCSALSVGNAPWAVALADIDGDGDSDMAISIAGLGVVRVLRNTGGNFATILSSAEQDNAQKLVFVDVDGDTDLDLVGDDYYRNTISVRKNNGTGSYGAPIFYPVYDGSRSIAMGDFDSDGFPDVASSFEFTNKVGILLNKGDGSLIANTVLASFINEPDQVIVGDLNSDKKYDLVVSSITAGAIATAFGDGQGGFAAPFTYPLPGTPSGMTLFDAENDGDLDLAVARLGENLFSILLADGTGYFVDLQDVAVPPSPNQSNAAEQVEAADMDGDGDIDLLVYGYDLHTYKNNGQGAFSIFATMHVNDVGKIVLGDIDGDSDVDVLHSGFDYNTSGPLATGSVRILLNSGDGSLFEANALGTILQGSWSAVAHDAAMADLDLDGVADLAVAYSTSDGVGGDEYLAVYFGLGNGEFYGETDFVLGIGGGAGFANQAGVSLRANDYDGDGDIDVAFTNGTWGNVALFVNNGDGTFSEPVGYAARGGPVSLASSDFDGDGDVDLCVANAATGDLSILLNQSGP